MGQNFHFIWSCWPAIFEPGLARRQKAPLGVLLKSTRLSYVRFYSSRIPREARGENLLAGVSLPLLFLSLLLASFPIPLFFSFSLFFKKPELPTSTKNKPDAELHEAALASAYELRATRTSHVCPREGRAGGRFSRRLRILVWSSCLLRCCARWRPLAHECVVAVAVVLLSVRAAASSTAPPRHDALPSGRGAPSPPRSGCSCLAERAAAAVALRDRRRPWWRRRASSAPAAALQMGLPTLAGSGDLRSFRCVWTTLPSAPTMYGGVASPPARASKTCAARATHARNAPRRMDIDRYRRAVTREQRRRDGSIGRSPRVSHVRKAPRRIDRLTAAREEGGAMGRSIAARSHARRRTARGTSRCSRKDAREQRAQRGGTRGRERSLRSLPTQRQWGGSHVVVAVVDTPRATRPPPTRARGSNERTRHGARRCIAGALVP